MNLCVGIMNPFQGIYVALNAVSPILFSTGLYVQI